MITDLIEGVYKVWINKFSDFTNHGHTQSQKERQKEHEH